MSTYRILVESLPSAVCFVHMTSLSLPEATSVVRTTASVNGVELQPPQVAQLIDAFSQCPLPLYLRICVHEAKRLRSFELLPALPADTPALIAEVFFQRLEVAFGAVFVAHALAYITACVEGLSQTELEDVLSCDEAVLDSLFLNWMPPVRRLPPLLWTRIREALGPFLVRIIEK